MIQKKSREQMAWESQLEQERNREGMGLAMMFLLSCVVYGFALYGVLCAFGGRW